jgi:hypothetical protein
MTATVGQVLNPEEFLEYAERQTEAQAQEHVRWGDLLPIGLLAQRIGTTVDSLAESVRAGRLFTVTAGGKLYLPSFLAEPGVSRQDLEAVIPLMASRDPWSKFVFFTSRKISLGGSTPLQALRRGDLPAVLRAARNFSDR